MVRSDPNMNKWPLKMTTLVKMIIFGLLLACISGCAQKTLNHETATAFERQIDLSLERLYTESPVASEFKKLSKGLLVFPEVTKVGFVFGGQYGKGAMIVDDKICGYYTVSSASFGLFTLGTQSFGMVMFLMTDEALSHLQKTSTWQFGSGLKTVIGYKGIAVTAILEDDIYVFVFGQKGIMAELGSIEAMRITRFDVD